jgi:hypothetical protein
MDPVKRLMKEYGVDEKIAQRAWDACCDGNYLSEVLSEYDDAIDPWDGKHEELRKEVEAEAVREAKANATQEEKSQKWPFEE